MGFTTSVTILSEELDPKYVFSTVIRKPTTLTRISRLCAVLPSLTGSSGASNNERAFLKTLVRLSLDTPLIFTFHSLRKKEAVTGLESDAVVIQLPTLPPVFLSLAIYSVIIGICVCIFNMVNRSSPYRAVYARGSELGWGLGLLSRIGGFYVILKLMSYGGLEFSDHSENRVLVELTKVFMKAIDRLSVRTARKIAIPTREFGINLTKFYGLRKLKCVVVPIFLDLPRPHLSPPSNRQFDLGYFGSSSSWQGVELLLNSVAELKNTGFQLSALLGLSDGHGHVLSLARRLKIEEEVTVVGPIPHERMKEYYFAVKMVVLPRLSTPTTDLVIPISLLEALHFGCPVIVSESSPIKEIALQFGGIILFRPGSSRELTGCIRKLASDSEYLDKLAGKINSAQVESRKDETVALVADLFR